MRYPGLWKPVSTMEGYPNAVHIRQRLLASSTQLPPIAQRQGGEVQESRTARMMQMNLLFHNVLVMEAFLTVAAMDSVINII